MSPTAPDFETTSPAPLAVRLESGAEGEARLRIRLTTAPGGLVASWEAEDWTTGAPMTARLSPPSFQRLEALAMTMARRLVQAGTGRDPGRLGPSRPVGLA